MSRIAQYLKSYPKRQHVRPWALATPVLVLVVALPLLRPLRAPEPYNVSANELSRLAAVQAMAENHAQEIDGTPFLQQLRQRDYPTPPDTVKQGDHYYSDKAPVLSAILAGAYLVISRFGITFAHNQSLVVYLLTVICSVIPVAASAGMVYKMGRLFELRRPWRMLLAVAVTFGSGLITYAVVINAHAPAAALVLGACACLVHTTVAKEPTRTGAWFMTSGFCAALAAVIDPAAVIFFLGLVLVIVALRWRKRLRFGGVLLYLVGALPPVALHAVLTVPVTGDLLPPSMHADMRYPDSRGNTFTDAAQLSSASAASDDDVAAVDDDGAPAAGWLHDTGVRATRALGALAGGRGIFSHFPVILFGLFGIGLVLRRHWPVATKTLAGVTLLGAVLVIAGYVVLPTDARAGMFGPRWFIVFLPLILFWGGAWLRKPHHPVVWSCAAIALLFSVAVSLLGTTAPFLAAPPGRYTAAAALKQLLHPAPAPGERPVIAQTAHGA